MLSTSCKLLPVVLAGFCWFPLTLLNAEEPSAKPQTPEATPDYLNQGWHSDVRESFYHLTQGSQLVPYEWFLSVEQPGSEQLFRSNTNLARLGYIVQLTSSAENPDGLPIGFAKDDNPATVQELYETKQGLLGEKYERSHYPGTNSWLGFTCAACHTGEIHYNQRVVRVDGGPSMANHELFMGELVAALKSTEQDEEKFTRFAKRVLKDTYQVLEANQLRRQLRAYTEVLDLLVKRNAVPGAPYGNARLDAFGAILNEVSERALGLDANHRSASAPVSYPCLWDTSHLDWVQWNGSAANPIARNVGEVLGVYGQLKLQGIPMTGQFQSTANLRNLYQLESWISTLSAPTWPEDLLGAIDLEKSRHGEDLFKANCARCHHLRDQNGEFPLSTQGLLPNSPLKGLIKTVMVRHDKIGTDPQMVLNFVGRTGEPGDLKPHLPAELRDLPVVPAGLLLKYAVKGAIERKIADLQPPLTLPQLAALSGYRVPDLAPPMPDGYKARPLNGVWATAPYLHNGSVPTLYQLLLPEIQRMKTFHVGSKQYDPKNVGFSTRKTEFSTEFRALDAEGKPIPGNSNLGHSGPHCTQTKGETGFRDFTEEERWALVEFMKTLK